MKEFENLKTRLKIAKSKIDKNSTDNNKIGSSSLGIAMKLSTEMVAAVIVGTIIGFILDTWFDSKPWFILIFFFVGVAAGITNVFRSAKLMQDKDN
jgi:ATP synthase protein I|tara:strand:- start:4297 stop:4584 length:288 start_codon:yes stop_codon:yes gene_type:complete